MSSFCCSHSSGEWRFLTCRCPTESVELCPIGMTELRSMVSMEVVRDRLEGRGTVAYHGRQRYSRSTPMGHENVRLGIGGHLNALGGSCSQPAQQKCIRARSRDRTGGAHDCEFHGGGWLILLRPTISRKWQSHRQLQASRRMGAGRASLRHRVLLPRQKCIG